jgi:hypothetical protein
MIIVKEKEFRLIEMAKMKSAYIPRKLLDRTLGRVVDEWWWDENEYSDIYKVGYRSILTISPKERQNLYFDYGFIRPYKNLRQGKSTGAKNDLVYEFRALHFISKINGETGQWYRDDYQDTEYENVYAYEDNIDLNTFDSAGVIRIVRDLKLKPATGTNMNILSILDRLLK